jgi:hypothetical protein
VDPVINYWESSPDPIPIYQAATWGPREAADMIAADGRDGGSRRIDDTISTVRIERRSGLVADLQELPIPDPLTEA